jgi:hypothetical protein
MYVPRHPLKTNLHQLIRENYRQVFFNKEIQGTNLPFHLDREFKKYLTCGNLSYGMARFHCSLCHKAKLVAFSCKGRTLCPSCTGRRMADTAKHLIHEVIPNVPTRQWVLSMPYAYRFLLARNPEFLRLSLALFHRAINQDYLKRAKKLNLKNPKIGAIMVVQRFGGALNLNVHFHTIYTDGVFYENQFGGESFFELIPEHEDIVKLNIILKNRLTKLFKKFEFIDDFDDHQIDIQSQSVQNRDEHFKLPIKIGKVSDPPFIEFKGTRCSYLDGFSLHANVKILSHQRSELERLCRYILRGPIANDRISYDPYTGVRLKLKSPYTDGTTHLQFTPDQFIKRIIALIPPPRQNLIRYVGVFGARHKKREVITSMAQPKKVKTKKKTYRTPWSELLRYVFKYEVNYCDYCGTKLQLVATIKSQEACHKILTHLKIPIEQITTSAPRAPPELDFFDQAVGHY